MDKKAVLSLHGIRTRGVWQKELVPELALKGLIPYALDYGHFPAARMALPWSLNKSVDQLLRRYDRICLDIGHERPSIVAHSYGTLQVASLLHKYSHVKFDTVIMAGGIVPTDFPWGQMLDEDRVRWAINDLGGNDRWPRLAAQFIPHAGRSGAVRFTTKHRALQQVYHADHGHSDYFNTGHFRTHWVPALLEDRRSVVDRLDVMRSIVAKETGISRDRLRAFVLRPDAKEQWLRIHSGLHVGDATEDEVRTPTALGMPGPGQAPAVAFSSMREVRQTKEELQHLASAYGDRNPLHPELEWSISTPIPRGAEGTDACGVLIIDGLAPLPAGKLGAELFSVPAFFTLLIQISGYLSGFCD